MASCWRGQRHADVHGGQFEQSQFKGQQCTACHDRLHFEPHAFTLEKHELTALPLTGQHVKTDCNDCHLVPDPVPGVADAPRAFHGTPSDCDACHRDAHAGFFDERAVQRAAASLDAMARSGQPG